ncbi:MAG: DUF1810 domain-containing protein, partial [Ruminococcus sp.]|nr:DUF1810 domain-containing protein [Ruminococcus sp.]
GLVGAVMCIRASPVSLQEVKNGLKISHWIWYIFPQIKGLGKSYVSAYYGIDGIEEAKEYYNNPILREHLIEITNAVLTHKGKKQLWKSSAKLTAKN